MNEFLESAYDEGFREGKEEGKSIGYAQGKKDAIAEKNVDKSLEIMYGDIERKAKIELLEKVRKLDEADKGDYGQEYVYGLLTNKGMKWLEQELTKLKEVSE